MRGTSAKFLVLVTCNFILVASALQKAKQADDNVAKSCIPRERDALLAFKQGITNDNYNMLVSWRGHDCCQWKGVTCSNQSGHVIKLDLHGSWPYYDQPYLVGQISPSLLSLEYLDYLDLSSNPLTGPNNSFPEFVGSIKNLRHLDLSNMYFSNIALSFFGNLSYLEYLDLSWSMWEDLSNLSYFPVFMSSMKTLRHLGLSGMPFTGRLPSFLGNMSNLEYLDLSGTPFSGNVPPQLGNLSNLQHLVLGPIDPVIWNNLPSLYVLDLSNNELTETIPPGSGNHTLLGLSGNLPSLFRSCSSLAFVDLAWNNFNGTLPLWIGDLMNLQFLQMSHNKFYGDIPISITNLRRLQHLNLANNNISGDIPLMLSNLTAMTKNRWKKRGVNMFKWYARRVGEFKEVIPVVMKQQELKYGAEIFEVVGIDLSHNHLTGGIPIEITSLNKMMNLNLSWNQLSGNIPEKIGDMESVVSLDLSWNNLSGQIPSSLSELTYISKLDLSYNNLTGTIPVGRQLDTLYIENPSMYDGNNGLCGPPLRRNCSGNNAPEIGPQKTRARFSEHMFFYFGFGSGFTVGLGLVFCAMLFKKT
ncbi:hypothetical protein EJB05_27330, partial [Eragrostis curvula]